MKRKVYLLAVSLLLAGCGSNEISSAKEEPSSIEETSSIVDEISSSTESGQQQEISQSEVIDTSRLDQFEYVSFNELYLQPNESYYLSKMFINNNTYCSYATDMSSSLTIDSEKGIIKANDIAEFNDDSEVVGNLYLYDDSKYQQITIHIVDKEEYGDYFMSVDLGRLYEKNVIFFGDSITHNWLKYPYGDKSYVNDVSNVENGELGYNTSYVVRLKTACNFKKTINAAWSGGTMAYLPKSPERFTWKSFPCCVDEHQDDLKEMDYVFVFYGTNDLTDQVPIGSLNDDFDINGTKDCGFKPSMRYGIERIQEANPNAKIIFFNLLYRTYGYNGTIKEADYNEAIDSVCKSYMIKSIDISNIFNKTNFTAGAQYTDDGLHPNGDGYEVITKYILNGQK